MIELSTEDLTLIKRLGHSSEQINTSHPKRILLAYYLGSPVQGAPAYTAPGGAANELAQVKKEYDLFQKNGLY